jgi:hypothetical protein
MCVRLTPRTRYLLLRCAAVCASKSSENYVPLNELMRDHCVLSCAVLCCAALRCVLQKLEKHYVPLNELMRNHWHGLLLQTGYEACE